MKNLLHFLPVTSQVCDLVSALMEVSFLVFQKAVQPSGLMGLLGVESAGRLVRGALCEPSLAVMSLSLGVSWSWDPWKPRATKRIRNNCGGCGTLGSQGGHRNLGERRAVPVLMKAGAGILAAALPCAAYACTLRLVALFVPSFATASSVAVRFFNWKGLSSRVTTTEQISVWDGYSPHFFGRELTVNER